VWPIGRRHHNLTTNRHQRLVADDKRCLTFVNDEDLGVWVHVKLGTGPGSESIRKKDKPTPPWSAPSKSQLPISCSVSASMTSISGNPHLHTRSERLEHHQPKQDRKAPHPDGCERGGPQPSERGLHRRLIGRLWLLPFGFAEASGHPWEPN
jgi:hypothetical protein